MFNDRRNFLKSFAVASMASCAGTERESPRIDFPPPVIGGEVAQIPVLADGTGLKIQSIETYTRGANQGFVRVKTDSGLEGWGQVSNYDVDLSAIVLHRKVASYALGKDPAALESIVDRCIEGNYKYPWSYVCRALTGLETAIWDLLGKLKESSVCELLGGRPRPIPVYGSSMSRTITPDKEAERLVRLRDQKGFQAFKVRVGKVCGRDQDQWPGRTDSLIPTVRKRLGDDVDLLVDGNSCYTPPKAIEVGRKLEDHGYCHFEEPCPYWELEWTAIVASALNMPVAGGEQDNDLAQWRRMVRMKAVDIVQPDICYVGGLLRALRVAAFAKTAGLDCVPHSANLSLVTVFTLHMFGAIDNAGKHVEYSIEPTDWTEEMYEPRLEVMEGRVSVPDGPGWGITVNPEWLANAVHRTSEV
jgi:L-alanine-DL-glutamate epimerase-like enolase superfamily enzyme